MKSKYILVAFLIIPFTGTLLIIGKNFVEAKLNGYKLYKLNHISKDMLSSVYTNYKVGYTFNYPTNGNVYKWFGTEENILRVFSENYNQGFVCDIYVNHPQRKDPGILQETLKYNDLIWEKWKDVDDTDSIFDRHVVSWYTEKKDNHAWITSIIEVEGYCESIVSTFKFTK